MWLKQQIIHWCPNKTSRFPSCDLAFVAASGLIELSDNPGKPGFGQFIVRYVSTRSGGNIQKYFHQSGCQCANLYFFFCCCCFFINLPDMLRESFRSSVLVKLNFYRSHSSEDGVFLEENGTTVISSKGTVRRRNPELHLGFLTTCFRCFILGIVPLDLLQK